MDPPEHFVTGQRVDEVKAVRARELRRRMTPAEAALWARVRRNQLAGLHFRRQQVILGFIADFFCARLRLVVELDGSAHDGRAEADLERDQIFAERGLTVLRFLNGRVETDMPAVLAEIAAYGTGKVG